MFEQMYPHKWSGDKCHFYEPPAHNGNLAAGAGTDVQAVLRRRQMTQMFHDHAAESDNAALLTHLDLDCHANIATFLTF